MRLSLRVDATPPREAMPNARPHWGTKARAIHDFREAAWAAAYPATEGWRIANRHPFTGLVRATVIVFWEKGRKQGDTTNVEAALKAMWDGFTDAKVWADDKQLVAVDLEQRRDEEGRGYVVVDLTDEEVGEG